MQYSNGKLVLASKIRANISRILCFVAGIIGLLGLVTPAAYVKISVSGITHLSWDSWMFGFHNSYDYESGRDIFWTGDLEFLMIQLAITIIVIILNIFALVEATGIRKNHIDEQIFSIISPIGLVIAMIAYIVFFEIWVWAMVGVSFWSLLSLGFAIISQFIASGLMFIGFFIKTKLVKSREKEDLIQIQKYMVPKMFIETYFSENEKNKWIHKLEIVKLHQNGINILKRKVESLATKKYKDEPPKTPEYEKAIENFLKAVDLTPKQPVNYSKIDLDLAYKIIREEDKKKALEYLNEIRRDTAQMLGQINKHIRNWRKSPFAKKKQKEIKKLKRLGFLDFDLK